MCKILSRFPLVLKINKENKLNMTSLVGVENVAVFLLYLANV
jgi:hypothetical protein